MRFVAVKPKELRWAIELDATGELKEENGIVLETPEEWSPEHLLLAGLVRCSLKSLRYHAGGIVEVGSASGSARTLVTRPTSGGPYAMVETTVELAVELDRELGTAELSDLLALAERDCFIGSSLTAKPDYRWTVNGRKVGW